MCAIPQTKHTAASKTVSVISVLRISIAPSVSSGRPSAFVEAARQALLAPFLIDKGRLPALLAQIADPLAGTVSGLACPAGRQQLADVLGQRARQRVRQRQDLGRAEPGRLTAADARELTDDLLEPPPGREGRRRSQHERDQAPQ